MLKKIMVAVVLVLVCFSLSVSHADTYTRGKSDHPLRYISYVFYPLGITAEYLVLRPIHKFVSRDPQSTIFGHQSTPEDEFPGWGGRRRFDDSKARTPLFTFMTPEEQCGDEDPVVMMREEMEAEMECMDAPCRKSCEIQCEEEVIEDIAPVAADEVTEKQATSQIKVEVAESA